MHSQTLWWPVDHVITKFSLPHRGRGGWTHFACWKLSYVIGIPHFHLKFLTFYTTYLKAHSRVPSKYSLCPRCQLILYCSPWAHVRHAYVWPTFSDTQKILSHMYVQLTIWHQIHFLSLNLLTSFKYIHYSIE